MKLGRSVSGFGWRVRAEYALGKSVVWREAWKREVRSVVLWSEWVDPGVEISWRARWAKWAIWVGQEWESKRLRIWV